MSSSLIDAVPTHVPAEVGLPALLDAGSSGIWLLLLLRCLTRVVGVGCVTGWRACWWWRCVRCWPALARSPRSRIGWRIWIRRLVPARLGLAGRVPAASTVWRFLVRLDATVVQAVLTGWLRARLSAAATTPAAPAASGRADWVVIAVDGKVLRAARQ